MWAKLCAWTEGKTAPHPYTPMVGGFLVCSTQGIWKSSWIVGGAANIDNLLSLE